MGKNVSRPVKKNSMQPAYALWIRLTVQNQVNAKQHILAKKTHAPCSHRTVDFAVKRLKSVCNGPLAEVEHFSSCILSLSHPSIHFFFVRCRTKLWQEYAMRCTHMQSFGHIRDLIWHANWSVCLYRVQVRQHPRRVTFIWSSSSFKFQVALHLSV